MGAEICSVSRWGVAGALGSRQRARLTAIRLQVRVLGFFFVCPFEVWILMNLSDFRGWVRFVFCFSLNWWSVLALFD